MTTDTGATPPIAAAGARPALRIADLAVRYPGRREPSLRDVTIAVARGEQVGIAGRTGAGKSTLALASAGFIPRVVRAVLDGAVEIDGLDIRTTAPDRLLGRVGIVFATPANQLSASKLTVREELAFGLENLGVPRDQMDDRIEGTLARLNITHLADREPFALSGGEQQRVAIASIVAMGTDVLVLDEPTAQLDPAGTSAVSDLLAGLAAAGAAILCVEHDPAVLSRLDRCLVLDAGHPVAIDRPGGALATAERTVGLDAPTLVRIALVAGVAPGAEFDEIAIVRKLQARALASDPVEAGQGEGAAFPGAWIPDANRPPAMIEIQALFHRYPNGVEAVQGVDLTVEPGEAVAIVGQNGSGKTTLVKHLVGLLRPATGRILIDGATTNDRTIDQLAQTVGFVFQDPDDQLFERSVEREVAFGPRNLGLAAEVIRERVERSLDAVALGQFRGANPYDLDLSQRKLIALAGVLAMDPAVLVLDEPTTGQDAAGIVQIARVVHGFRAAGRSVIAITHDMEFAAANFTRIVVMRDGLVIADGPPLQIFQPRISEMLRSTGLMLPPVTRIGAMLGLDPAPVDLGSLFRGLRSGRAAADHSLDGRSRPAARPHHEEEERGLDDVDPGDDRRHDERQGMAERPAGGSRERGDGQE